MVLKWDSQQAMKPVAFDQDDHVRSQDSTLDIAVVSRGGRLNSTWKKVCNTPSSKAWYTVSGFSQADGSIAYARRYAACDVANQAIML